MGGLAEDYADFPAELAAFYADAPRAIPRLPESATWAPGLIDAMDAYQEALHAPKPIEGAPLCVLTGQQPGIFTGPLYSIYKAVTAIHLAKRYSAELGCPVAPIYWIGSDDHDLEEVATVHVLTKQHEPLALHYAPEHAWAQAPLFRVPADDSLHALADEARARCAGSEFAEEVLDFLHESIDEAQSLGHWYALLLARLFRDTDLRVFVPHLAAARQGAAPVFRREIETPLESTRLANDAGARLESLGYGAQVTKGADECNFFLDFGGRRRKVLWQDGQFYVPEEQMHVSPEHMLHTLESNPERFTANVITRPVVQQTLFPTLTYVGGPGEIAYWGQLRGVFDHFARPMPLVYPRVRAVLTNAKVSKLIRKFGWRVSDLDRPLQELEQEALLNVSKHPALEALQRQRPELAGTLDRLAEALSRADGRDAAIGDRARHFAEETLKQLGKLEHAIAQADEAQVVAVRTQVQRVVNTLAPDRKPQERFYSLLSFLFEYGWELMPRLMREMDPEQFGLNEIEL